MRKILDYPTRETVRRLEKCPRENWTRSQKSGEHYPSNLRAMVSFHGTIYKRNVIDGFQPRDKAAMLAPVFVVLLIINRS